MGIFVRCKKPLLEIARCERGLTAIEYGVIALLIAAAIVLTIALLGERTTGMYDRVNSNVSGAMNG